MGRRILIGSAVALAFLFSVRPTAAQFSGAVKLVSVNNGGTPADADSWAVDISADGKMVAFASDAANLVPLDNNGDTDIFLRNTRTQITSRVSVNWQGEEAHGDSDCPSISGDGRYVAFRSNAWNMVQGGGNVGEARWDVYLHDRAGPLTVRLSTPTDGGRASADSGCPVLSDDGAWVAFSSEAADLIGNDTNEVADVFVYSVSSETLQRASLADDGSQLGGPSTEPSISADGSVVVFTLEDPSLPAQWYTWNGGAWYPSTQILARDRIDQTTETVSQSEFFFPRTPLGPSFGGMVSGDGNLVAFTSLAGDMASPLLPTNRMRVYVYDRQSGETERIEPERLDPYDCGDSCSNITKAAAFSADGRFVAYMNGSFRLLPENPITHQDQIYLQDRETGRLQRVSVDPTGYPLRAYPCGGSRGTLSLSGDGSVLAMAGENLDDLGLPARDAAETRDVVRIELNCDSENGACREISRCPPSPHATCQSAGRSRLRIGKNPPLAERRERFSWRWVSEKDDLSEEFVDPTAGNYNLCLYAGEDPKIQLAAGIPNFADWHPTNKGWMLKDNLGAIERVRFRTGVARSAVKISSSSPALGLPYLPLNAPQGIRIQLHESTTGRCWEAAFPSADIRMNRRGEISAQGSTRGAVHAILR